MSKKLTRPHFEKLTKQGYYIVNKSLEIESLLKLQQNYGNIVFHPRSDKNGINTVTVQPFEIISLSVSDAELSLHTDGSYEENSPAIFCLQCISQSKFGGESIVVSGKDLYKYLENNLTVDEMQLTFENDFFNIQMHGKSVVVPLFRKINNKIQIRFRKTDEASKTFVRHDCKYCKFIYQKVISFIEDHNNQICFKLKEGDILVMDNFSMLHGRKSFDNNKDLQTLGEPRKLNRIWFDGGQYEAGFYTTN